MKTANVLAVLMGISIAILAVSCSSSAPTGRKSVVTPIPTVIPSLSHTSQAQRVDKPTATPADLPKVSESKTSVPSRAITASTITRPADPWPDIVHFATNKSNINAKSQKTLDKLVGIFKEYPNTNVLVEGHTDNTGADSYNMTLSKERAQSVTSYLTGHGLIPPTV